MGRGARASGRGGLRGRDGPRGAAAAAAHQVRAGEEDGDDARAGRSGDRPHRQAVAQGQARGVRDPLSMATTTHATEVAVEAVDVCAYEIPTDAVESDGT